MLTFNAYPSKLDSSINYVCDLGEDGIIECRYVKRPEKNHHNIYLSAQTYCAQGCLFCHLTATKQIKGREITTEEIADQAEMAIQMMYFAKAKDGYVRPFDDEIHFLFMARGDVLASTIPERWKEVCEAIDERVIKCGFDPEKVIFKISTIFPEHYVKNYGLELAPCFMNNIKQRHWPIFYYSLYNTDTKWLNHWMPNAEYPSYVLDTLKSWQNITGMKVGIHFAPLSNGFEYLHALNSIIKSVKDSKLEPFWNLVYFNPPNKFTNQLYHGNQNNMLEFCKNKILTAFPKAQVKIQPRVGQDVAASCGMFGYKSDNKFHLPVIKL